MDSIKLKIEGMSCAHCKMRVQNALEKVDGVKSVKVSLKKQTAEIKLFTAGINNSDLINALSETAYKAELL